MRNSKNLEIVMDQGLEMVEFYRQHPCVAAYDLLGVDLAPIQRVIFRDMWFKNYVIAVCSRGFGKSCSTDSMTLNENGLVYLDEMLPPVPSFLSAGQTMEIAHEDVLYTAYGYRKTKRVSLEKSIAGLKLTTQNGFEHKGSPHHPLLILDSSGNFIYKKLEDFQVGDRICIQRGQNIFGKIKISELDAYLIGLFIGDGSISDKYNHVSITTSDTDIIKFCTDYCKSFGVEYRIDKDKRTDHTVKIVFKKFDWFFEKYNIYRCLSYDKCVPKIIRTADENSQISFLRGYFDADGEVHNRNGGVSCSSVSKKLLKEIQLMLLNFGAVARLRTKSTGSNFGKAFVLDMFSFDAKIFSDRIGFGLERKQVRLDNYFNKKKLNPNKDTIPFVKALVEKIKKLNKDQKELTYTSLYNFVRLLNPDTNEDNIEILSKLNLIMHYNYYFDTVTSLEDWSGDCYDFQMDMDEEPNYFANGFVNHNTFLLGTLAVLSCLLYPGYRVGLIAPVFRQSKMIFNEVEKIYAKSPIVREATEKRPTRGSDTCYLKFKSVRGSNPSFIEALPLGDGSKIRGSRFYLIVVDELAQVPDQVLDMVVRPMGATTLEPMERVRELERQRQLIERGLATEDDFEEARVNKMVMTSSGYYKFNHMWRRMKDHWRQMEEFGNESQYKVWQVPHWDLPEGFLDRNNIAEAKRVMSDAEFRMEYEAAMISDSEGFFKASLLDACTINSGHTVETRGDRAAEYVVGIDPAQGGSASCGITIIKLGNPNRIINVLEVKKKTTQELTKIVQHICTAYNVARIYMDKGGGGKAIMDLLEDGYDDHEPIIDRTDDDKRHMKGRHILEMVNFNPTWIADANFTTLALLEDQKLLFPEPPMSAVDILGEAYENVKTLKKQMLNIIVSQTPSGALHFDTPKKGQNKDLYSALILAAHGVRMFNKEMEGEPEPVLYNKSGVIREHSPNANWRVFGPKKAPGVMGGPPSTINKGNLNLAVLKKKPK